jgi:hypothetical protein
MSLPPYARLKGIDYIGESTESPQLAYNLLHYFNWGLLHIGGFNNVTRPNGNAYKLRLSTDERYAAGRVWEAFRPDFVWETGFEYTVAPVPITGVYVNNVFVPRATVGTLSHKVNYNLGQVIFNSPIALNSDVQLEFSYRTYHFVTSDEAAWWHELMFGAWTSEDPDFWEKDTGAKAIFSKNRIPLPAVVIETVPRRTSVGLQLGGGSWVYQDVLFHIYSRTPWERDKICDIIHKQKEKTIWTFDKNKMVEAGVWPLDDYGDLKSSPMMYPDMVKPSWDGGYFWRELTFNDTNGQEIQSVPGLYRAMVRVTCELCAPEL